MAVQVRPGASPPRAPPFFNGSVGCGLGTTGCVFLSHVYVTTLDPFVTGRVGFCSKLVRAVSGPLWPGQLFGLHQIRRGCPDERSLVLARRSLKFSTKRPAGHRKDPLGTK